MGNSHDRRKERRVKEIVNKTMEAMSADSSPLLPKETKLMRPGEAPFEVWRKRLDVLGLLGLVTSIVASFPSVTHLLPDVVVVAILMIFIALLAIRIVIAKTLVSRLKPWMRVATGIVLFLSTSGLLISAELKYRREHIPYCYAFFYRGVGPDGSVVGGRMILEVANATKEPARNVVVTLLSSKPDARCFDPSMQKKTFLPIVYPLPLSPPSGSNVVVTPLDHWTVLNSSKPKYRSNPRISAQTTK